MTTDQNTALWLPTRGGPFQVGPAPDPAPGPEEVVVRARAVAVNPVDGLPGLFRRVVLPWLSYPAVLGSDVAGEVVQVGAAVRRLRPGDRVVGHALGVEEGHDRAAEGAFQLRVVLQQHMVSPIPDALPFEQAAVLPLALSTAATGLFQADHLGLALPSADPVERDEVVLVWGAATSVGGNAVQLARNAGYRVVATASPRTADHVRSLGAARVVDRTSPTAVDEVVAAIGGTRLAGGLAIGAGSLPPVVAVAGRVPGSRRVASAQPGPVTRLRTLLARRRGVAVSTIWGSSLEGNAVGPAVYVDFLPTALATGAYRVAPEPTVVGEGLASIPAALERLRAGVSATKLVVPV